MPADRANLERESHVALHTQIADHLAREIGRGELAPGQQLESEHAIGERFGVSRITVRQALQKLADQGLVVRKQGKGTYVSRPAVQSTCSDRAASSTSSSTRDTIRRRGCCSSD